VKNAKWNQTSSKVDDNDAREERLRCERVKERGWKGISQDRGGACKEAGVPSVLVTF
jgi:hypothetical protein